MENSIRRKLFDLIRDDDENDLFSTIFDSIIILLILLNVSIVILDTFKNIPDNILRIFSFIEKVSVIVFTLEYIARIWTAVYISGKEPITDRKHIMAQIKCTLK
jgi:voltage-gated potassium channel